MGFTQVMRDNGSKSPPLFPASVLPAIAVGLLPVFALLAWRWSGAASPDLMMAAGSALLAVGLPLWHARRANMAWRAAAGEIRAASAESSRAIHFDSHPLPMWVYDVQTLRIVDVNQAAIAMYGYARDAFLKLSIADLRPSEDVAALKQRIARLGESGEYDASRWRHRIANGQLVTVDVYGRLLPGSDGARRVVCVIDRSAEQDALEALLRLRADLEATVAHRTAELESREATYRVLAELSPQILWQADGHGRITYVSHSWNELVGVVDDDGKPRWLAAMHPDDRPATLAAFEAAARDGGQMRVRRRFRTPQGGYRTFLSVGAPVPGPDGRFGGWVGVDTDISELEHRATRLMQTNADLESMSYTVSHDLRGPVQVIKGFVDAVLSNRVGRVDEAARQALVRVLRNAERMDELITDLLALSRLSHETLDLRPVDPVALAGEVAVLVQDRHAERSVECMAEWVGDTASGRAGVLLADRRLLRVVLENLIGNAVKFTPGSAPCRVDVQARRTHDAVILGVADRGVGFPAELTERLFRPFQRLHSGEQFPGTGIGLATVHRIVQLHGGTIEGRNREGGGALFEVLLPLRTEAQTSHSGQTKTP